MSKSSKGSTKRSSASKSKTTAEPVEESVQSVSLNRQEDISTVSSLSPEPILSDDDLQPMVESILSVVDPLGLHDNFLELLS